MGDYAYALGPQHAIELGCFATKTVDLTGRRSTELENESALLCSCVFLDTDGTALHCESLVNYADRGRSMLAKTRAT